MRGPTASSSRCRSARQVAAVIADHLAPSAPSLDVGWSRPTSPGRWRRICRPMPVSFRLIRSPARIPLNAASPNSSSRTSRHRHAGSRAGGGRDVIASYGLTEGRDDVAGAPRHAGASPPHIPHLIAYNIVGSLAADLEKVLNRGDRSRSLATSPASRPRSTMWRDVFPHNREAVLRCLASFIEDPSCCSGGDGEKLFEHFTRTRGDWRAFDFGQDTTAPD